MTGTAANARHALTECQADLRDFLFSDDGSSRMVYLIDGILYKVDTIPGTNDDEYTHISNTRALLPANVAYPATTLYRIGNASVIACELIKGQAKYLCTDKDFGDECDDCCFTDSEYDIVQPYLNDPSGMNVILNDGVFYIIDAA